MMTLLEIADLLAELLDFDNVTAGSIVASLEKTIGIYQRDGFVSRECIGGDSSYQTAKLRVLVHWGDNPAKAEEKAFEIAEMFEGFRDMETAKHIIKFADVKAPQHRKRRKRHLRIYRGCRYHIHKKGGSIMSTPITGVYPCYENQFSIDKTGGDGLSEDNLVSIADMESFSVSIDGNVEEWSSFTDEGWMNRLVTGKSITISVSGKRNVGDAGNDYVAGLALKTGQSCNTTFVWNFPSGAKLVMPCVINVTEWGAGESRTVAPLAFDAMSRGKPDFTPAA